MLQIDHIYHFLFENIFHDFLFIHLPNGVPATGKNIEMFRDFVTYQQLKTPVDIFLFYDQEPVLEGVTTPYVDCISTYLKKVRKESNEDMEFYLRNNIPEPILVTSEKSKIIDTMVDRQLYYFFHGFAALDWFRGYYPLNYSNAVVKKYAKDFISFNRTITEDRAYRRDLIHKLKTNNLLKNGFVSYNVIDSSTEEEKLVIDQDQLPASVSASIPVTIDRLDLANDNPDYSAFWHVVTETVFYYPKLHLTEKIFKPIVSKQPFMLLAAPGNLEYLRSYGFKTFEGIIDESYDEIEDNDARINAVVSQLKWYCDLSDDEKTEIQRKCEPIIEHNFHHFYGKFREIITDELLDNTKKLFKDIGYDDSAVDYATVRKLLTS